MPKYFDSNRNLIRLGDLLGSGGEGDVYALLDSKVRVVKIYKKSIDKNKVNKLEWMAKNGNQDLMKFSAWVLDTAHSEIGEVVGFLMPRIDGNPIHQLYSPQSRKKIFPKATWRFLLRVAENLATCFQAIHDAGQVIGDINHANCFVKSDGTVALIDCDSFSIQLEGQSYETEVVTSSHLAPELQCIPLQNVPRTQDHDNFGLAVLIFQLLFLGRHPFSGRPLGSYDSSLEEDIRARRFAYGSDSASRGVDPPPHTLDLESVSKPVENLFRGAFLSEVKRPSAKEWRLALQGLQGNLKKCFESGAHHFYKEVLACPWCKLEQVSRRSIFEIPERASSATQRGGTVIFNEVPFDISDVQKRLEAIRFLYTSESMLLKWNEQTSPGNGLKEYLRPIVLPSAMLIVGAVAIVANVYSGAMFAGLISLLASLLLYVGIGRQSADNKAALAELQRLESEWASLESRWVTGIDTVAIFSKEKKRITDLFRKHEGLDAEFQENLLLLDKRKREIQLHNHLARFRIDKAVASGEIRNVGRLRLDSLLSNGIVSAADVNDYSISRVPGFGARNTGNVIDWRNRVERLFVFDPANGVTDAETQSLRSAMSDVRDGLVGEIKLALPRLERQVVELNAAMRGYEERVASLAETQKQVKARLYETGFLSFPLIPLFAVSIIITFLLYLAS